MPRPLPDCCRWIDSQDASFLHFNFACVAVVYPDGRTTLQAWGPTREVKAASLRQGKRFVERWVNVQRGLPGFGRPGRPSRRGPPAVIPSGRAMARPIMRMPEPD